MDPLTKDHREMAVDDIDDLDIETFDDEAPRRDTSEEQVDGGNRDYI